MFPEPSIICLRGVMKRLVIVIRVIGCLIGYLFNITRRFNKLISLRNYKFVVIAGSIWFIPFLRTLKIREIRLSTGGVLQKAGDKGWYEHFGGQGGYHFFSILFMLLNNFQVNRIKVFIKVFLVRVILIIFIIV